MPDLLIELFCEEIPARLQRRAADELKAKLTQALVDKGLTYEAARPYWTPRRLTLDVRGLDARSKDVVEERKGPRVGAPDKAVEGFLRAAGLQSVDEAQVQSDPKKGDHYVAVIRKPGQPAETIIADATAQLINDFTWPKSMRWGRASAHPGAFRWVRPLQSILCTFGAETEDPQVIEFRVGDIQSGNTTHGHRFHAPEAISVKRFDDYAAALDKAHVVLDADRRKDIILTDAKNLAFANGLTLVEDEALLEDVAGLVEWPNVLLGTFDESFLQIPEEIIQLTIRQNQFCFVCKRDDKLSNHFILTANIEAPDQGAKIIAGNEKVVRARLADAVYFWHTDQADLPDRSKLEILGQQWGLDMNKPLDQRLARLVALNVTFHAKLGTQGARIARIRRLASEIAKTTGASPELVDRAALLAKADLQTEVVGEFAELQGFMGRTYAGLQNENASVATAIEQHYKPQGPSDAAPTDLVALTLALADKLDTLAGFWAIGETPTGSKDPFALRRAALGIIRILIECNISLPLAPVFEQAIDLVRADGVEVGGQNEEITENFLKFLIGRLTVYLRDGGARHDLVSAVTARKSDDCLIIAKRVDALGSFLGTGDGTSLLAGLNRASSILQIEEKAGRGIGTEVDQSALQLEEENSLYSAIAETQKSVSHSMQAGDFSTALGALAMLRDPVDTFFDQVLVNEEDQKIRANRLALLANIRQIANQIADFSQIEG